MITQKELKRYFNYDMEAGKLYWKNSRSGRNDISKEAGCITNYGYRRIMLDGKLYFAHRLIWRIETGNWPENEIDHINHTRNDNRFSNLRDVTNKENQHNRKLNSNNTSENNGIYYYKRNNKWSASIHIDGKNEYLGIFKNKQDAISARKEAEIKYGYHKNHGRR